MKRIWFSFSIIFGVVPDEISECQPLTAPQAMVMNRNGNRPPAQTGPEPSMNRVTARHLEVRPHDQDADGEQQNRADLEEGGEIVARREQEPHRQHRGDEAVADDHERQLRSREGRTAAASAGVSATVLP